MLTYMCVFMLCLTLYNASYCLISYIRGHKHTMSKAHQPKTARRLSVYCQAHAGLKLQTLRTAFYPDMDTAKLQFRAMFTRRRSTSNKMLTKFEPKIIKQVRYVGNFQ